MKIQFRVILTIFFAVLISFNVLTVNAFAEGIEMNAESELNGTGRIGCVVPVRIDIKADNNIKGILNLISGDDKYSCNVEIPKGERKTYTFMIPEKNRNKDIKVVLLQNEKTIAGKTLSININNSTYPYIGVLSDSIDNYRFLKNINIAPLDISNSEVIDLKKIDINYSVLKNIDFIIIDDFDYINLNDSYKEDIDKWLKDGGIIFLGKGKYEEKNFSGAFKNIKDVIQVGNGAIVPVNFELSDKNNINKFSEVFLKNMNYSTLCNLTENRNVQNELKKIQVLKGSANSMVKVNKNTMFVLISLLILYLTSLLFLILFKKKKFYMWFLVVFVFSAVSYIVYVLEGAGELKVTIASINQYAPDMYESKYIINIYPGRKDNRLDFESSATVLDLQSDNAVLNPVNNSITQRKSDKTSLAYNISVNTMDKDITNQIKFSDGYLKGEIKNNLLYDLQDSFLMVGDTFVRIGDIKSGQSIKIDYRMDNNLAKEGDFEYINTIQNGLSDKYEKNFIEYYPMLKNSMESKAELVGFTKRKSPVNINDKNTKVNSINMEIMPVKINFISNNFQIPEGVIKPCVKLNLEMENIKEYTFKKDEDVKIYYKLPCNIKAKKINIENTFEESDFVLERFNYSTNSWENMNTLSMDDLKFLNGNYILAVRVKGDGRFVIPSISVTGGD